MVIVRVRYVITDDRPHLLNMVVVNHRVVYDVRARAHRVANGVGSGKRLDGSPTVRPEATLFVRDTCLFSVQPQHYVDEPI
jgi:hypothetical protein